ncbi:adenosine deaminase, partial [Leucobacter sp. M11]|uniref:adenosine deaminase n=1 Tax=Leucobacter sp. M11 TaxID=2993565 RepID=UPI003FA53FAA
MTETDRPDPQTFAREQDAAAADPNALNRTELDDGVAIEDLPKVSLHDHLDGGLRPQTVIDIATRLGIELPETDAEDLADWFYEQSSDGTLEDYLETFELTVAVMQHPEDLRRVAREWVLDLAEDGVIYGEARWAPEQHLTGGLTLEAAVQAVQTGLDDGVAEVIMTGGDIRVGQVLCAMRQGARSADIALLALHYRDAGVVGFDLAGPEDGFPAEEHAEAFEILAEAMFPTTVHAGEAAGIDSVRGALIAGNALRLGHGTRLAEDITVEEQDDEQVSVSLGRTAQWVKDRGIALEMCPSSNLQTGAWGEDLEDHPFDIFYQLGMAVTVSPDNRLMSDTSVSRELGLLVEAFDYDLEDLLNFQLNAANAAFLPMEDRLELMERISVGFALVLRRTYGL